jgi:membrane-bound ClpP family serine protease
MLWVVITLILVGILLLLLEVLVIPGSGITGIIGFLSLIGGIWVAYTDLGIQTGNIVLGVTLLVNGLAVWLAFRYKTWKRVALSEKIDSRVNVLDKTEIKVGDRGITLSRCAPMGKAEINGVFVEVNARTEFIDQEKPIEVVKIEGNKIYIKPV